MKRKTLGLAVSMAAGFALSSQAAGAIAEPNQNILVTKTVDPTSFVRYWDWTIDKSADQSVLTLAPGQTFLVDYAVTVDASYIDVATITGRIDIYNGYAADGPTITNVDVTDLVLGVAATVTCPYSTVDPLSTMTCAYAATGLKDGSGGTNTATVTFDVFLDQVLEQFADTATADFTFLMDPTSEVDTCVNVDDSGDYLGLACRGATPKTFTYSMVVGPYDTAGVYERDNVARATAVDTETITTNSWRVTVNVVPEPATLSLLGLGLAGLGAVRRRRTVS